jgi:putative FmdB family regulatory protein
MPLYIFYCPRCKEKKELFKHKADAKAICPDCEKQNEIIQMKLHPDSFKTAKPLSDHDGWFKYD